MSDLSLVVGLIVVFLVFVTGERTPGPVLEAMSLVVAPVLLLDPALRGVPEPLHRGSAVPRGPHQDERDDDPRPTTAETVGRDAERRGRAGRAA